MQAFQYFLSVPVLDYLQNYYKSNTEDILFYGYDIIYTIMIFYSMAMT
jgi:hypothetical protein